MENKKNKKSDLSRRSLLFFQIGLILMLFLVWQAIEWKTYGEPKAETSQVNIDDFQEESVPVTVFEQAAPPPPAEIVNEVEIADDDEDVVESVMEPTEDFSDDPVEVDDVVEVDLDDDEEIGPVSFEVVEDVPIYPGCESLSENEERKKCMSQKITEFVNRKFDTNLGSELGLSGINRIYVQFRIESDGSVTVIGARGPHPKLEEEAIRVAKGLPEMQPGKQRGKAVGVLYTLPIIFRVQD